MQVKHGEGRSEFGPGVSIELTGDEVADAIFTWLKSQGVTVRGPRTVTVNGQLCAEGRVYVDPCGTVMDNGEHWSGRGPQAATVAQDGHSKGAPQAALAASEGVQDAASLREDGWYWVRRRWSDSQGSWLGAWVPALWQAKHQGWFSARFQSLADDTLHVGPPLQQPPAETSAGAADGS